MRNRFLGQLGICLVAGVFFGGCKSAPPPGDGTASPAAMNSPATTGLQAGHTPQQGGGASNTDPGILPMGGGAMSPVTNPGAVDGAGSSVGQMAKERAKAAASREGEAPATTSTDDN